MKNCITYLECTFLFVFFLVYSNLASAQSSSGATGHQSVTVESSLTALKVEPLALVLYQERKVFTYNTTILYGLGGYYSFYSTSFPPLIGNRFINHDGSPFGRNYSTNAITPYAMVGARKYFTIGNRFLKGKDTRNNAASYVGLLIELPLLNSVIEVDAPNLEIAYPVSLLVGLRRNLANRLFLDLEAGLSYKTSNRIVVLLPRLNLAFNYRIK